MADLGTIANVAYPHVSKNKILAMMYSLNRQVRSLAARKQLHLVKSFYIKRLVNEPICKFYDKVCTCVLIGGLSLLCLTVRVVSGSALWLMYCKLCKYCNIVHPTLITLYHVNLV